MAENRPTQRRPISVDEALSSMLWTPYDRTPSISSASSVEEEDVSIPVKNSKFSSRKSKTKKDGKSGAKRKYNFPYFDRGPRTSLATDHNSNVDATKFNRMGMNYFRPPPYYQQLGSRCDAARVGDFGEFNIEQSAYITPTLLNSTPLTSSASFASTSSSSSSSSSSSISSPWTWYSYQLNNSKPIMHGTKATTTQIQNENGNTGDPDSQIVYTNSNNNNNTMIVGGQYMDTITHTIVNDRFRVNQLHTNESIHSYESNTNALPTNITKSVRTQQQQQQEQQQRQRNTQFVEGEMIVVPNMNNNKTTMTDENINETARISRIRVTEGITLSSLSSTVLDNSFESRNFSNFPPISESVNNTLSRNLYSSSSKRVMRLSVAASTTSSNNSSVVPPSSSVVPLSTHVPMSASAEDIHHTGMATSSTNCGDLLNKSFPTTCTKISSESQTMATLQPTTSSTTTVFVQQTHKSDNSRIISNGTLMGALVPTTSSSSGINTAAATNTSSSQPSLTIHVNQCSRSDHHNNVNNQNKNLVNMKNNDKDVSSKNKITSGVSVVNCYRAVPVNIVNQNQNNNNIENESSENCNRVEKCNSENHVNNNNINNNNLDAIQLDTTINSANESRTFTSTEAQTDDLLSVDPMDNNHRGVKLSDTTIVQQLSSSPQSQSQSQNSQNDAISREQRRRERRERRQSRRPPHPHPHHLQQTHPSQLRTPPFDFLPDILNSSMPPPYSTLPGAAGPIVPPPIVSAVNVGPPEDLRYAFSIPVIRRSPSERSGKGCCGQWFAGPPLRAVIAVVALGGVACALGGIALGATGLAGPPASHLTAALLMIGVGVILVTVSGAAWRLTAPGTPACLGFSSADLGRCGRRPCGRAQHGLLYPEFQHRPPPPSYQASMQEYRLRLLLLDRDRQANIVRAPSPPPPYRSHNGTLARPSLMNPRFSSNPFSPGSDISLPPSYHHTTNAHSQQIQHQPQQHNHHRQHSNDTVRNRDLSLDPVTVMTNEQQQAENDRNINNIEVHSSSTPSPPPASLSQQSTTNLNPNSNELNSINCIKSLDDNQLGDNSEKCNKIVERKTNKNSSECNEKSLDSISLCNSGNGVEDDVTIKKSYKKDDIDLVTIVTISGCTDNGEQQTSEMEILAHL